MATWQRVTSDPVTTERRVRVTDGDRQGYADVRWLNGFPRLAREVYTERDDSATTRYGEPVVTKVVLDGNPKFA